ncbi:hypothetical protein M8J77_000364 [Diaphorina citri]|nr:hypothetical protein M8J77_000364 [Diaphorina citri]
MRDIARRAGGVAIYLRDDLSHKIVTCSEASPDACLEYMAVEIKVPKYPAQIIRYRDLKRLDSDVLEDRLAAVDWLTPLSDVTLDEMVQLLSGQITEVFDDVAPIVEKRATRPPIPWMNADVKNNMVLY